MMPSDGGFGIFVKRRGNFTKLTIRFTNLLETVFCGFGKNPRMPSTFSKPLELLYKFNKVAPISQAKSTMD